MTDTIASDELVDADVKLLRQWADALVIPSGDFVNQDLRRIADRLSRLSDKASMPVADPERCDACLGTGRIIDGLSEGGQCPFCGGTGRDPHPAASPPADELREALKHLPSIAENFLHRFNVHDLPEGDAQQWQALEREIALARAALQNTSST